MTTSTSADQTRTLHIGLVACSAEGAALCYRSICTQAALSLGSHRHPEISIHSHSLSDFVRCLESGDLDGIGELMLASARKLADIGADFLICPDNTIHQALPTVIDRTPLPWLHIADVVAAHAVESGYVRPGLIGTQWLVESDLYLNSLEPHGLKCIRPSGPENTEVSRIIMEELVHGEFVPKSVSFLQRVIQGLKSQSCDAVILGCTEISLIINDTNSPLPTLDSTRLLARAALRYAMDKSGSRI